MSAALGSLILRALRLANGAAMGAMLVGLLGGYYFWPGLLAYLSIAVAVLGLAATFTLSNLLGRIRLLMWLLPYADRLKDSLGVRRPDSDSSPTTIPRNR